MGSQPASMTTHAEDSSSYPFLQNLVRCYFDQDYDEISENVDEIFEYYKAEAFPGTAQKLIEEVSRFLATYDTGEEQLTKAFRQIFRPELSFFHWKGRTTRETLLKIIEIM
jgi:hypothetical protein